MRQLSGSRSLYSLLLASILLLGVPLQGLQTAYEAQYGGDPGGAVLPYCLTEPPTYCGGFISLVTGLAFLQIEEERFDTLTQTSLSNTSGNADGFTLQLHIGWGTTLCSRYFLGGRLGYEIFFDVEGRLSEQDQSYADYRKRQGAIADLMPGLVWKNCWLTYLIAGAEYGQYHYEGVLDDSAQLFRDQDEWGWLFRLGLGLQWAVDSNWSWGLEYTHGFPGPVYFNAPEQTRGVTDYISRKISTSSDQVTIGITFYFNGNS